MVSVIVPVYNAGTYLDVCVKSLLSQTYADMEVLLVDDCSSDGSGEKCDAYSQDDNRIRTFHFQENKGPSAARNFGMRQARGEWIMFVDADDWLEERCAEETVRLAQLHDADIVIWDQVNHIDKREIRNKPLSGDERIFSGANIAHLQKIMLTLKSETGTGAWELTGPVCKLYRAELLQNMLFPENINSGEDLCFVMQVFQVAQKVFYIAECFYHRVILKDSLSQRVDFNFAERRVKCVNWITNYCAREGIASADAWNEFSYRNFKMVLNQYMHVLPAPWHFKAYGKIRWYLEHLEMPLNLDMAHEEDPRVKQLLQRGWYYRYKCHLVWRNIKGGFFEGRKKT